MKTYFTHLKIPFIHRTAVSKLWIPILLAIYSPITMFAFDGGKIRLPTFLIFPILLLYLPKLIKRTTKIYLIWIIVFSFFFLFLHTFALHLFFIPAHISLSTMLSSLYYCLLHVGVFLTGFCVASAYKVQTFTAFGKLSVFISIAGIFFYAILSFVPGHFTLDASVVPFRFSSFVGAVSISKVVRLWCRARQQVEYKLIPAHDTATGTWIDN